MHADGDSQPIDVADDPPLSLGLAERHEEEIGPGLRMRSISASSSSGVGSPERRALGPDDLEARVRSRPADAPPPPPPPRRRRAGRPGSPCRAASSQRWKIRSEPATRSGSGVPSRRDAQTSGAPVGHDERRPLVDRPEVGQRPRSASRSASGAVMKKDGRPAAISRETASTASSSVIGANGTPQTQTRSRSDRLGHRSPPSARPRTDRIPAIA